MIDSNSIEIAEKIQSINAIFLKIKFSKYCNNNFFLKK